MTYLCLSQSKVNIKRLMNRRQIAEIVIILERDELQFYILLQTIPVVRSSINLSFSVTKQRGL